MKVREEVEDVRIDGVDEWEGGRLDRSDAKGLSRGGAIDGDALSPWRETLGKLLMGESERIPRLSVLEWT